MSVFRVDLRSTNRRTGEPHFIVFACEYGSVEALSDALNNDQIVKGTAMWTRPGPEPGTATVLRRYDYAIARGGIGTISAFATRLVGEGAP